MNTDEKFEHLHRLQETQNLYMLARSRDPESRSKLGAAITDMFSSPLTLREQEIVTDILMTLLIRAERDLKRAVADRLAVLANAPLKVILFLSNDEIEVAQSIITRSPVLTDSDLMFIIQTHKSPHWQAVATRPDLKAPVIDALTETRDVQTARVLVGNRFITIPQGSLEKLVEMAHEIRDLKEGLLDRDDLPPDVAKAIYAIAAENVARETKAIAPDPHVQDTLSDVADEYMRAVQNDFMPSAQMIQAAERLASQEKLNAESMMRSLKNGQIASYIAQMIVFLQINFDHVDRMLRQESGEYLAAFCRIARADKRVFLQMYLMTQRYRSGDRMVDSSILNNALLTYDQTTYAKAEEALKSLRLVH